jgi:hypothetical protein
MHARFDASLMEDVLAKFSTKIWDIQDVAEVENLRHQIAPYSEWYH